MKIVHDVSMQYNIWATEELADSSLKLDDESIAMILSNTGNLILKLTKTGAVEFHSGKMYPSPILTDAEKLQRAMERSGTLDQIVYRTLNFRNFIPSEEYVRNGIREYLGFNYCILPSYTSQNSAMVVGFFWDQRNRAFAFFGRDGKTKPSVTKDLKDILNRVSTFSLVPPYLLDKVYKNG